MAILGLLTAVSIALAANGGGHPAPTGSAGESIRVVSITHEVNFPVEIVFRMEAEATASITNISLFYRLAGGNVRVYGVPEFTPGRQVSADFTLKTSGSQYLPLGIDIEYYYVITDALGSSIETPRSTLRYMDPRFDWRELRQGDLIVLWHDLPEDKVLRVADNVSGKMLEVKEMFDLDAVPPMKAVIVNTGREAARVFPFISGAARDNHLFAGFAYGEYDLFVLASLWEDGMVHEATHLLLDEAVSSPLAVVPAWLNEGLAMYFESSPRRDSVVPRAARSGSLLRLRAMKAVPGRPQDVRLFYAQARSLVSYMVDTFGAGRMTALLSEINRGGGVDAAAVKVYGLSLDELEARWLASLGVVLPSDSGIDPGIETAPRTDANLVRDTAAGRESEGRADVVAFSRPDVGTVATSLLIGGSAALAMTLALFRRVAARRRLVDLDSGSTTTERDDRP